MKGDEHVGSTHWRNDKQRKHTMTGKSNSFWGGNLFFSIIFVPLLFKDSSRSKNFFLHFEGWGKP
jgi:hypothetical protein